MRGVVRILELGHMVDFINAELWYAKSLPIQVVYDFTSAHISALQLA